MTPKARATVVTGRRELTSPTRQVSSPANVGSEDLLTRHLVTGRARTQLARRFSARNPRHKNCGRACGSDGGASSGTSTMMSAGPRSSGPFASFGETEGGSVSSGFAHDAASPPDSCGDFCVLRLVGRALGSPPLVRVAGIANRWISSTSDHDCGTTPKGDATEPRAPLDLGSIVRLRSGGVAPARTTVASVADRARGLLGSSDAATRGHSRRGLHE